MTTHTPNLGGKTLNLIAKDDAAFVHAVRATDVMNGVEAMPFGHPWFAMDYYRKIGREDYAKKFEIVFALARMRNRRLMKKVNAVIAQHEGKKQFDLTNMDFIDTAATIAKAHELGMDVSKYMDETMDEDDVSQCSNAWCLNQNETCGKAADNVVIITDLDGVDWFILIVRQNGPGRSQLAWAGGFVDKDETFKNAAIREMYEEMYVGIAGNFKTIYTDLDSVKIMDWDPRAKFVNGMEVAARVTHHVFEK